MLSLQEFDKLKPKLIEQQTSKTTINLNFDIFFKATTVLS